MGDTKDVYITRVFNFPIEAVWHAWVTADLVKQWWGPMGFTCPVADMHVEEGEASLVCMRAPKEFGGMDIYNTWTYTVVKPSERLEYTLRFTDKNGNVLDPAAMNIPAPKEVPHIITFAKKGDHTEVTVTEKGYANEQVVETSRKGMEECLDKMVTALEASQK